MPDATRQRDWTPDVTVGNQDVPGQMNQAQPPALGGDQWPSEPGQVVQSQMPNLGSDTDVLEEVSGHLESTAGEYFADQMPDDLTFPEPIPGGSPVPLESRELTPYRRGMRQFATSNGEAVATFERASSDWSSGAVYLSSANMGVGPIQVVGRQKGRKSTTLIVPAKDAQGNAPNGCIIASTQGELQGSGAGAEVYVLNVGDSVTIPSEAGVWAQVIPGNTTGYVQFVSVYNPPGGELGGF